MAGYCDRRNVLHDAWRESTYLYAKAVKEFSDKVNTAIGDDLEFLRVKTEQARHMALYTHDLYQNHVNEHRCHASGNRELLRP